MLVAVQRLVIPFIPQQAYVGLTNLPPVLPPPAPHTEEQGGAASDLKLLVLERH